VRTCYLQPPPKDKTELPEVEVAAPAAVSVDSLPAATQEEPQEDEEVEAAQTVVDIYLPPVAALEVPAD